MLKPAFSQWNNYQQGVALAVYAMKRPREARRGRLHVVLYALWNAIGFLSFMALCAVLRFVVVRALLCSFT